MMRGTPYFVGSGGATQTTYSYDALSRVIGKIAPASCAGSTPTTASYGAMTTTYNYDAFGEFRNQTDARGVVTSVPVRDALGRELTRQASPPVSTPPTNTGEVTVDVTTYDLPGAIGAIASQTRLRGTILTAPTTNPTVWQQTYAYDTAARLITTTTQVNEGTPLTYTSATTYDADGRVQTHVYPNVGGSASGLSVTHTYTAYGQLDAKSQAENDAAPA